MRLIFYIAAGLFVLKLIWNVGVPVDMFLRRGQMKNGSGVSLMPSIEVALMITLFICSFFIDGNTFHYRPIGVLLMGSGSIALSYILMLVIGRILKEVANHRGRGVGGRGDVSGH